MIDVDYRIETPYGYAVVDGEWFSVWRKDGTCFDEGHAVNPKWGAVHACLELGELARLEGGGSTSGDAKKSPEVGSLSSMWGRKNKE